MRFIGEFSEEGSWNAVSAGRVRLLTFSKTVGGGTENPTGWCWGQLVPCLPPRDREKETESLGLSVRDCCGLSGAPSRARPPFHPPRDCFFSLPSMAPLYTTRGFMCRWKWGKKPICPSSHCTPANACQQHWGWELKAEAVGAAAPWAAAGAAGSGGLKRGPLECPVQGKGPGFPAHRAKEVQTSTQWRQPEVACIRGTGSGFSNLCLRSLAFPSAPRATRAVRHGAVNHHLPNCRSLEEAFPCPWGHSPNSLTRHMLSGTSNFHANASHAKTRHRVQFFFFLQNGVGICVKGFVGAKFSIFPGDQAWHPSLQAVRSLPIV